MERDSALRGWSALIRRAVALGAGPVPQPHPDELIDAGVLRVELFQFVFLGHTVREYSHRVVRRERPQPYALLAALPWDADDLLRDAELVVDLLPHHETAPRKGDDSRVVV